jgi:hypothetical protein
MAGVAGCVLQDAQLRRWRNGDLEPQIPLHTGNIAAKTTYQSEIGLDVVVSSTLNETFCGFFPSRCVNRCVKIPC